jgi:hypothetical protein
LQRLRVVAAGGDHLQVIVVSEGLRVGFAVRTSADDADANAIHGETSLL